jgi:hypothetical protein
MTDTDRAPRWIEYRRIDDLPEAMVNPRLHGDDVLDASLDRFGFTEPPLIDERTGRLVAGHGRKSMALRAEAEAIEDGSKPPNGILVDPSDGRWLLPIVRGWASKDDDEALAYLLAANRTTEIGGWSMPELNTSLWALRDGPGLDGIGYTPADVDLILASLAPPGIPTNPADEWGDDMPEFEQGSKESVCRITVHFMSWEDRDAFFKLIERAPAKALYWPEHDGHVGVDGTRVHVIAEDATGG